MNIQDLYNTLHIRSSQAIRDGKYVVDRQIDSPSDRRYGITLLLRPSPEIKGPIEAFQDKLKEVEGGQYYYPPTDIHITILSIISCYNGFNLEDISPEDYVAVIAQSLDAVRPFRILFKGVIASETGALIQGFPDDSGLDNLRNALRENFRKSGLQQSIDSRYPIRSAHATVMRFRHELKDTAGFLQVIEQYRTYCFGEFPVTQVELVYNDWYQKKDNCRTLHVFRLGG